MTIRYGFRRRDSKFAHFPGWVGGRNGPVSACGRVEYDEADVWSSQDVFDDLGSVTLCRWCYKWVHYFAWNRISKLKAWEQ